MAEENTEEGIPSKRGQATPPQATTLVPQMASYALTDGRGNENTKLPHQYSAGLRGLHHSRLTVISLLSHHTHGHTIASNTRCCG